MVPVPVCEYGELAGVDFAIYLVDEGKIDARDELNGGWVVGVVLATGDLQAVYAVLVHGLTSGGVSSATGCDSPDRHMKTQDALLTCPGPIMVPFQWLIMISSESSRPYEHEPSPMPFSPFSSSSSRRKLRGTGGKA